MSPELIHCSMANKYLEQGRTALRTAVECLANEHNNGHCDNITTQKAHEVLHWANSSIEQLSLALHVFENNNWVEEDTLDKEIMKLLKAAVRLQGIVLYNLQLMRDGSSVSSIHIHEHYA